MSAGNKCYHPHEFCFHPRKDFVTTCPLVTVFLLPPHTVCYNCIIYAQMFSRNDQITQNNGDPFGIAVVCFLLRKQPDLSHQSADEVLTVPHRIMQLRLICCITMVQTS